MLRRLGGVYVGIGMILGPAIGGALGVAAQMMMETQGYLGLLGAVSGILIGLTVGCVMAAAYSPQQDPKACSQCGYSLEGLQSAVCPECGAWLKTTERNRKEADE